MDVNKYSAIIKKNFSYLFSEFGFKVIYQNQNGDSKFYVGLQADTLKVKILFAKENLGSGLPLIGHLTASFHVLDYGDQWVGLIPLLHYLGNKEINWTHAAESAKNEDDLVDTDLILISETFKPFVNQSLKMFTSEEVIKEWKPKYEEFLATLP